MPHRIHIHSAAYSASPLIMPYGFFSRVHRQLYLMGRVGYKPL